ncbi:MAG: PKD domain-containing protein [Chitinophagaceae bacterium]|nr:MAG: PKD domain-containing protein [Chitinophagaceae bacterium]
MKILYPIFCVFLSLPCLSQTANFSISTPNGSFCAPQVVTFQQTSSGNPESFVWDFGNGRMGNQPIERITYVNPGTYIIKLIAVYRDVAVTTEKTIVIHRSPNVTLTAERTLHCKTGEVSFTASGTSTGNYIWDFGDGSQPITTSSNQVSHNFTSFGSFTVRVKSFNAQGCSQESTTTVNINPLQVTGTMNITSGCLPARPQFRVSTQLIPEDGIANILWEFGDGSAPVANTSNNIQHSYTTTDDITAAKVTVTTNLGCKNEYYFPEFGFGLPPTDLSHGMVSGRDTFCGSEYVEMNAIASGAEYYLWNFGDGRTDSVNTNLTEHRYRKLGDMMVSVTPYQNGCPGTPDSTQINIEGVISAFNVRNTCDALNSFTFPNQSLGNIDHLAWTYGDDPNVRDTASFHGAHVFPSSGSFYADLLLVDDITGCRDSVRKAIYTALPLFISDKNSVCKDSMIRYHVEHDYDPESGFTYEFHVNGEVVNNGTVNHLQYFPTAHGLYDDFLVIKDNYPGTCHDTVRLSEPVRVKGPVIDFSTPFSLCYDSTVAFINNSYPFYDYEPISNWEWNFGNDEGDTAHTPNPYSYPMPGSYNITLTATDVSNCMQKTKVPIRIRPLPIVDILPRHDTLCLGNSLELIAYSSDEITWSPLPGMNCNNCDSVIVRPTTSTNYIANAISEYGCKNSDSSMIKVYGPIDLRVSPADTAVCLGESVTYKVNDDAEGIISWLPAAALNASNPFAATASPQQSSEYTVVIRDSVGCFSDTATASLQIYANPVVNAGADIRQDFNTPFIINASYGPDIVSYSWEPLGDGLSCADCPNPSGTLLTNREYTVNVTDRNGCVASDKVKVIVNCMNSTLLVPNAFTPNRDGLNDYFYPIARGFDKILSFMVFDRQGMKVFERRNFSPNAPSLGWDGTLKGKNNFNSQNFVWVAQVECEGSVITQKGTILLIK